MSKLRLIPNQLLLPSEFQRTHRVQDSHLLGVIATCTKDYHAFNFTQSFIVTQGLQNHPRVTMKASDFSHFNNAGLLTPDSNPSEFNVFVHSRSHAAAASRVPYMARCNRQTTPGCWFASGGSSTYNSRNTSSMHRCAFFTSMKLSFNGRLFRDALFVMVSEIRNLISSRCGVDAKKFALSSSMLLLFFTSFVTNQQRISGHHSSPLCVSTHFVWITETVTRQFSCILRCPANSSTRASLNIQDPESLH